MTSRQALRALAAIDNLVAQRCGIKPWIWEEEALARLRWHLMSLLNDRDARTFQQTADKP